MVVCRAEGDAAGGTEDGGGRRRAAAVDVVLVVVQVHVDDARRTRWRRRRQLRPHDIQTHHAADLFVVVVDHLATLLGRIARRLHNSLTH